jgi:hypothetical protein
LKLLFFTNAPLFRRNGEAEAFFKLRFPVDVDDFSFQVILPENALPVSSDYDFSIFPTPDKQFTGDNRYNVLWRRSNLSGNDELTFSITYSFPKRSLVPYLFVFFILIVALIWLFYSNKKKRELFLRGLGVTERMVMELLFERKETFQHELRGEIGVSKVKMTRIVQKLDDKGLIEKEQLGRKNKISLKI